MWKCKTWLWYIYYICLETSGLKGFKNTNICCFLICQSCSVYRNSTDICTLTWGTKFYHLHFQFSQKSRYLLNQYLQYNNEVVSRIQQTEVFAFGSAYIQGTWVNFLDLSWRTKKNTFNMLAPFNEPFFTSLRTSFWINILFWDISNANHHIWEEVLPENPMFSSNSLKKFLT